jgi:O-antigen/teichoic acid export membrane protein
MKALGIDTAAGQAPSAGSLADNAFWLMSGKTVGFGFSAALPLVLVRVLSLNEFGLYKQAFLAVNTAVWVLPLGFGMSAFYFLPRDEGRRGSVVFNVLLFNLVMGSLAGVTLWLWPSLLGVLFNAREIVDYAAPIALAILIGVVASFIEIVVIANQEARLATVFIVLSQFTKSGLLLLAAILAGTVRALVVAAVVQGTLQTLLLLIYLRARFGDFWRRPSWVTLREQLAYALPLSLSGLLLFAQTDLHNYFVAKRFDLSTYAVYAVGCFQLPLIALLAESVGAVLIPRISLLQKTEDVRAITLLIVRVMRKLAAVYFPLYGFMLVFAREFVSAVFTEQYAASWPILVINMAILPFSIVALDPAVRAFSGLSHFLLRLRIVIVVLQVAALWIVTARFGLVATISVVVSSKIVEQAILTWRAARALEVAPRDLVLLRDVVKIAIATGGATAISTIVRFTLVGTRPWTVLVVGGASYAAAYAIGLWLTDVLTAGERQELHRRLKSVQHQVLLRRAVAPQV